MYIDKTVEVTKSTLAIKDIHPTNSVHKTVVKVKVNSTYLVHTTVKVIKYGYVFHLDYSTEIIELYKRVIIES